MPQTPDMSPAACTSWDQPRLHEISEALRAHMLPHLTFPQMMYASNACASWHHLITTTPVQQLPARSVKGLLTSGLTSGKAMRAVLQQQGTLMAKLRGKLASTTHIQRLGCLGTTHLQLSWGPQRVLEDPSQWIQFTQRLDSSAPRFGRLAEGQQLGVDVIHVSTDHELQPPEAGPAHSRAAAVAQQPHVGLVHVCSAWEHQRVSARWTADGRHIAVVSACPTRLELIAPLLDMPIDNSDSFIDREGMLAVTDVTTGSPVAACKELALVDHKSSVILEAGNMVLRAEAAPGTILSNLSCIKYTQVVAYGLPDLQKLYQVAAPAGLLRPSLLFQKRIVELAVAPDDSLFAIHWELRTTSAQFGVYGMRSSSLQYIHAVSIHCASDGHCSDSHELPNIEIFDPYLTSSSHWDPSGSYLIFMHDQGACSRIDTMSDTGIAWTSTFHQRAMQPDSAPELLYTLWQGSPSGRFLCLLDEERDVRSYVHMRMSILDSSTGSIVHQSSSSTQVGDLIWSPLGGSIILPAQSLVISAPNRLPAVPESAQEQCNMHWRQQVLTDVAEPLLAQGGTSAIKLSPCGRRLVGFFQSGHHKDGRTGCLEHWQLAHDAIGSYWLKQGEPLIGDQLHPDIRSLAWHPQQDACVYAVADVAGGVHIIDARANCKVKSWTIAKLVAEEQSATGPAQAQVADHVAAPRRPQLVWSQDGSRLAAFCNQACAVLNF